MPSDEKESSPESDAKRLRTDPDFRSAEAFIIRQWVLDATGHWRKKWPSDNNPFPRMHSAQELGIDEAGLGDQRASIDPRVPAEEESFEEGVDQIPHPE